MQTEGTSGVPARRLRITTRRRRSIESGAAMGAGLIPSRQLESHHANHGNPHESDTAATALIGSAHSQFVQQRREWIAVALGAALGFVVWWPVAFLTPWGGGHWLAATLIGGGRWGAGQTLIEEANPAVWERMVRLYRACPTNTTTELCEAALAVRSIRRRRKGQRCRPSSRRHGRRRVARPVSEG